MIFKRRNRIKVQYGVFGAASGRAHGGMDISTPDDPTIHATVGGRVKWARIVQKGAAGWGATWQWGYFVWIVDADGTDHIYAHCSKLLVSEGQTVAAGQPIAIQGATGNAAGDAQGAHVHYEVRRNGIAINPSAWAGIPNAVGSWENTQGGSDMSVFLNLTGHAVGKNNQLFSKADPAAAYMVKDYADDGLYPVVNAPVSGVAVADTKWAEIAYDGGVAFAVYGGVAQDKAAMLDARGADKAFGAPMSTGGGVTQEALDAALQRAENAEAAAGQEKARADAEAARAASEAVRANKAEAEIAGAETVRVIRG